MVVMYTFILMLVCTLIMMLMYVPDANVEEVTFMVYTLITMLMYLMLTWRKLPSWFTPSSRC